MGSSDQCLGVPTSGDANFLGWRYPSRPPTKSKDASSVVDGRLLAILFVGILRRFQSKRMRYRHTLKSPVATPYAQSPYEKCISITSKLIKIIIPWTTVSGNNLPKYLTRIQVMSRIHSFLIPYSPNWIDEEFGVSPKKIQKWANIYFDNIKIMYRALAAK